MIDEDGEQIGVMDTRDAVQRAREEGKDLVEVAPNAKPPVCRIIDYGKFLYEEKKKAHEAKKKQVTVTVKEIKFRPATDEHDYGYRKERAREWIAGGDKVRATIAFRGREMYERPRSPGARMPPARSSSDLTVSPSTNGRRLLLVA